MKALVNGQLQDTRAVPPLPTDAAGVFETLRLRGGAPEFWSEHWERFARGCAAYGLTPPTGLRDGTVELARANGVADGVARFAAWSPGDADPVPASASPCWRLDVEPPRPHLRLAAFRVATGPTLPPPSADRAHKHLGRSHWLDALRRARTAGDDEVLLFGADGTLVEGAVSNVFVVHAGSVSTPPLSAGPLPGIIRQKLLELAERLGSAIAERSVSRTDLATAEEVWLTNSLIGIRPVAAIDRVPTPAERPVLARIRDGWIREFGSDPTAPTR